MPRLYTHILYGTEYVKDVEGEHFDDLEAACVAASRAARRMVAQEIVAGRNSVQLKFYIHDQAGALLITIPAGADVHGLD